MRISIEHIPATEAVLLCFMDAAESDEFLAAVKSLEIPGVKTASILKFVDKKDVSAEFIEALKVILALPDSAIQPPVIGFS